MQKKKKKKNSGSFKNVINKMETKPMYLLSNPEHLYSYNEDLALIILLRLIDNKTQQ